MKKILLLSCLLSLCLNSYSQNISIHSSEITNEPNGVNLNIWLFCTNGFNFLDYNYTINGNQIDVSICYHVTMLTLSDYDNVNEFIPLPNPPETYTMNVVVYSSNSETVCDYSFAEVSRIYTLSNETFILDKNNFTVFPNPTKGEINFESEILDLNSVKIYNFLGQMVKYSTEPNVNLSTLENGVYIALFETSNGTFKQKIILQK